MTWEGVRDNWSKVVDFESGAEYPKTPQDSFGPIMANLAGEVPQSAKATVAGSLSAGPAKKSEAAASGSSGDSAESVFNELKVVWLFQRGPLAVNFIALTATISIVFS